MWKLKVGDKELGLKVNTPTFSILLGSNLVFNPPFLAPLSREALSLVWSVLIWYTFSLTFSHWFFPSSGPPCFQYSLVHLPCYLFCLFFVSSKFSLFIFYCFFLVEKSSAKFNSYTLAKIYFWCGLVSVESPFYWSLGDSLGWFHWCDCYPGISMAGDELRFLLLYHLLQSPRVIYVCYFTYSYNIPVK